MFNQTPSNPRPTFPAPVPAIAPNIAAKPQPSFSKYPTAPQPQPIQATQPIQAASKPVPAPALAPAEAQKAVQNNLESLLPANKANIDSSQLAKAPQLTQEAVTALEISALKAKAQQLKNATQTSSQSHEAQSESPLNMRLTMRDALIMLDRDIPRAISVITTKHSAYPYGYLKDGDAFGVFLQSPSLIALLRCAQTAKLESLPLSEKLPELAVPRTAYILSSVAEELKAKGIEITAQPQDYIKAKTKVHTAYAMSEIIEDYLSALAPDDALSTLMSVMD